MGTGSLGRARSLTPPGRTRRASLSSGSRDKEQGTRTASQKTKTRDMWSGRRPRACSHAKSKARALRCARSRSPFFCNTNAQTNVTLGLCGRKRHRTPPLAQKNSEGGPVVGRMAMDGSVGSWTQNPDEQMNGCQGASMNGEGEAEKKAAAGAVPTARSPRRAAREGQIFRPVDSPSTRVFA